MSRQSKIYRVELVPPPQPELLRTPRETIQESLTPGKSVERYGREWIVGKTQTEKNILTGRIGYRGADGLAELWNSELNDFTEIAVPAGLTSPFAISLESLEMAVQPRGSMISLNGVLGAFKKLLGDEWRIETPKHEMTFEQWRQSIDIVTKVRFRITKPNPTYRGTPHIEALLEEAEANAARLELVAEQGIDTNSEFIRESLSHVERGYGTARYEGVRNQGTAEEVMSVYNSDLTAEEVAREVDTDAHGEVPSTTLAEALDPHSELEDNHQHGSHDR